MRETREEERIWRRERLRGEDNNTQRQIRERIKGEDEAFEK